MRQEQPRNTRNTRKRHEKTLHFYSEYSPVFRGLVPVHEASLKPVQRRTGRRDSASVFRYFGRGVMGGAITISTTTTRRTNSEEEGGGRRAEVRGQRDNGDVFRCVRVSVGTGKGSRKG